MIPGSPFVAPDAFPAALASPASSATFRALSEALLRSPSNSASVLLSEQNKHTDCVLLLIDRLFSPSGVGKLDLQSGLELFKTLIRQWNAGRQHYEAVCQHMRRHISQPTATEVAMLGLKVIRILARCHDPSDHIAAQFLFAPGATMEVSAPPTLSRRKGYAFLAWIRPESLLGSMRTHVLCKDPCLFRMSCSRWGIECGVAGPELKFRLVDRGKSKTTETLLGKLEEGSWNFVALSHNLVTGRLSV